MAKVTLELDLDVVQEAIRAETAPAVAAVLAKHYDLRRMAEEALAASTAASPPADADEVRRRIAAFLAQGTYLDDEENPGLLDGAGSADFREPWTPPVESRAAGGGLVARLLREQIAGLAERFVQDELERQRPALEHAFREMMRDSPDRLVQAFVGGLSHGLENHWRFAFRAAVTPLEDAAPAEIRLRS